MEEKKQIKISLGTAICIFILFSVLIVALVGTVIYCNAKIDKENNNQNQQAQVDKTTQNNNILVENEETNKVDSNIKFVEGNYIRSNGNEILPAEGQIDFSKEKFTLTLANYEITGKYEVADGNVKCNLENSSFEGNDAISLKEKNWTINFKIINDKKIKVVSNNANNEDTELSISLGVIYEGAEYTLYNLDNYVGTWNTGYASDLQGEEIELGTLFGTGYAHYGSKLILNEDGTFMNAIQPIQSGEFSNTGTWEYQEYPESTDIIWGKIVLKYADDREESLKLSTGRDSMALLIYSLGDDYQLHLYK